MALVTKLVLNACHMSAILVIHFIVGGTAVLVVKLGTRQSASSDLKCTEVSGRNVCIAKHLKTKLGSSFTVRVSA